MYNITKSLTSNIAKVINIKINLFFGIHKMLLCSYANSKFTHFQRKFFGLLFHFSNGHKNIKCGNLSGSLCFDLQKMLSERLVIQWPKKIVYRKIKLNDLYVLLYGGIIRSKSLNNFGC